MHKGTTRMAMATLALALAAGTAFARTARTQTVPFRSTGSGAETSLSALGCQFTAAGCTVESDGAAISTLMGVGPYTSILTIDWADATSNGAGGFCAPASGTGTITAANGDTVTISSDGIVCEVGATGTNVPHTFTGTFTITGGTGRFAGATGGGTETGGDDGQGDSSYSLSGTIILQRRDLPIT